MVEISDDLAMGFEPTNQERKKELDITYNTISAECKLLYQCGHQVRAASRQPFRTLKYM